MIDYKYLATVTNVVDGDTVDAVIDLGFHVKITERFRLLGVNAPERGKPGAAESTEWLKTRVLGQTVILQSVKDDSFGRWLCTLWVNDAAVTDTINAKLIKAGHAVPYRG